MDRVYKIHAPHTSLVLAFEKAGFLFMTKHMILFFEIILYLLIFTSSHPMLYTTSVLSHVGSLLSPVMLESSSARI
jgi:hypothetical protein